MFFNEQQRHFLKDVDKACQLASEMIAEESLRQKLENPLQDVHLEEDDSALMHIITGFGLMYNALTELGELNDVLLEPATAGKELTDSKGQPRR
jgi:hypothetical protein